MDSLPVLFSPPTLLPLSLESCCIHLGLESACLGKILISLLLENRAAWEALCSLPASLAQAWWEVSLCLTAALFSSTLSTCTFLFSWRLGRSLCLHCSPLLGYGLMEAEFLTLLLCSVFLFSLYLSSVCLPLHAGLLFTYRRKATIPLCSCTPSFYGEEVPVPGRRSATPAPHWRLTASLHSHLERAAPTVTHPLFSLKALTHLILFLSCSCIFSYLLSLTCSLSTLHALGESLSLSYSPLSENLAVSGVVPWNGMEFLTKHGG